jgi:hypothetical protein
MPEILEAWMSNFQASPVVGTGERHAAVCVLPPNIFATIFRDLDILLMRIPAFELHWNPPVVCEVRESKRVVTGAAVQI